jgi:uroporphyrinogen decarboxylase
MNARQRVLAAVARKPVDRNPITFDAEGEVYNKLYDHFGHRSREKLFDALGCDTWMVLPKNYIARKGQSTTIWGWDTTVVKYDGGQYTELSHSPLAGKDELSDIDNHPWPDPSAHDFSGFDADAALHRDRAIIGATSWGTYFIASFLRGMEGIMMDFAANPAYVEKLFAAITERVLAMLDQMLEHHAHSIDIVYMADDYCSQLGPLFSPELFKQYVTPYLRQIVERTHRKNKKFLLHVCGAVRPLLPMIIDCGVDMLEPIQVRAAGMEPAALKRDFGKHLTFYGGLDLQQVLCKGSVQTVREEVRRLIDILGDGGGYVFGPGHTYIQVDAPLENILAMYEEAQSHGAQ